MNHYCDLEFKKYEFAKYSFQECLSFLKIYQELEKECQDNKLSFEAMVATAFVVTYARPFSKSNKAYNGGKIGAISDKFLRELNDDLVEKHKHLIGVGRNSLAAHIDLGKLMPNIFVKNGKHNDIVFDYTLPVINENTISDYSKLSLAALQFCEKHQEILKPKLTGNHLIPETKA